MGRILAGAVIAGAIVIASWPGSAGAHPERQSYYPNFDASALQFRPIFGRVPPLRPIFRRRGGKRLVVCKSDSRIATFARGFGRDIYPPRFQRQLSEADELRLGRRARIRPGAAKSLTIAWRERGRRAVRIELPGGTLRVPPTSRRAGG